MKNASPPLPFPGVRLVLAVVLTGVAAGLAAASLSWMIHFVEHLAFGQSEAQSRIVTEGTTPERRMGALLCAGLLVTLCWTWLQVKGRPVVGIKGAIAADTPARRHPPFFEGTVHALLQIVAVGSGAPIGRELAPRELGSLFSGRICDRLGIDEEMRRLLVASGSAAGLAGVYQVPFAGAIFALEILLGRFTVTYGIVALAVSVIATVVARVEVTTDAFYVLGQIDGSVVTVLWSAVIGTLVGLPAAAFRRAVLHAEQYRAKQWDVLWALPLALLLTEVVAIWLPQVLGNGRSVAQTAYDGITMGMCLTLILGKSVVVLATLRGGAYGGTLQPAVALGALSGILLGTGLHQLPVWEWLPPQRGKGRSAFGSRGGVGGLSGGVDECAADGVRAGDGLHGPARYGSPAPAGLGECGDGHGTLVATEEGSTGARERRARRSGTGCGAAACTGSGATGGGGWSGCRCWRTGHAPGAGRGAGAASSRRCDKYGHSRTRGDVHPAIPAWAATGHG